MFQNLHAFYLLKKAQNLATKNNHSATIEAYKRLCEKYPHNAYGYYHFARYWVSEQDWPNAVNNIEQALRIQPNNPIFHHYQGVIYYYQNQYSQSLQSLKKSLQLNPNNCLTKNYIALVHLAKGELIEFKQILQKSGMFESDDLQIEMLFTLEKHMQRKK